MRAFFICNADRKSEYSWKKSFFRSKNLFKGRFIEFLIDKSKNWFISMRFFELKLKFISRWKRKKTKYFLMTYLIFNCVQIFDGQKPYIYSCLSGSKLYRFWIYLHSMCFNHSEVFIFPKGNYYVVCCLWMGSTWIFVRGKKKLK